MRVMAVCFHYDFYMIYVYMKSRSATICLITETLSKMTTYCIGLPVCTLGMEEFLYPPYRPHLVCFHVLKTLFIHYHFKEL